MTVKELLTRSEEISDWLDQSIPGLEMGATDRLRLSWACVDQVHEHVRATCLLLRHGLTGSAFALVRVTFETFCRGLWLRHRATDQEVADFQKDKLNKSRTQIMEAIESIDVYSVRVLGGINKNASSTFQVGKG
jgi:hypothetical protein